MGASPRCCGSARRTWRSSEGRDPDQPWTLLRTPTDPARPQLLLACHVDTVPVPDAGAWQRDPVRRRPRRRAGVGPRRQRHEGRAGRRRWPRSPRADPETPVALLLTSDEEIGSKGAAAAAAAVAEQRIGAVIVPEATGNQVVLGHKGALWLAVRTAGRAAHGSTPERGHNAVLDLAARAEPRRRRAPAAHRRVPRPRDLESRGGLGRHRAQRRPRPGGGGHRHAHGRPTAATLLALVAGPAGGRRRRGAGRPAAGGDAGRRPVGGHPARPGAAEAGDLLHRRLGAGRGRAAAPRSSSGARARRR